jgi:hypothetical protein
LISEDDKLFQPGKVELAALRLIVIPAKAGTHCIDPKFIHELEIEGDVIQVLPFIIIFQHFEGDRFAARGGMVAWGGRCGVGGRGGGDGKSCDGEEPCVSSF